ncbi:phosphoribosylformylglycinamidine synthase, partial [Candidatus Woesearchaeota archaeon CG_4_10_14_0_8_um_filter_47_5]
MPHCIEVALKPAVRDPRGEGVKARIRNELGITVDSVRTISVFTLDFEFDLPGDVLQEIGSELFRDKVIEDFSVDAPLAESLAGGFDFLVEKGFKPGVTDNVGKTAKKTIEFYLDRKLADDEKVYTSVQYLFRGRLALPELERICTRILGNRLIENFTVRSHREFIEKGIGHPLPVVKGDPKISVERFSLEKYDDKALMALSRERCLALNPEEFRVIQKHFSEEKVRAARKRTGLGEALTDVELEVFAQTWSEHCKHKEFNAVVEYSNEETGESETIDGLFATYIRGSALCIKKQLQALGADYLVKVFNDNAGIVRYDKDTNFVFKVETHNSPSALDPYGGAITGIVGVNRDPAGTGKVGAKPLFNTNVFCFSSPF